MHALRGFVAFVAILAAPATEAKMPAGPPVPCSPEGSEAVRIASVGEDFTLGLSDGRTILLTGIDPLRNTPDHPALATDARAKLEAWLRGRDVRLRALAREPDRWNRWPALVFADAFASAPERAAVEPQQLSVALAMVDAGLARARPAQGNESCWADLLRAEQAARQAVLGLWADPYYAMRQASDRDGLAAAMGAMTVVQGRITRLGQGRTRLYMGLGGPQADFSLSLARRDMFILAELGLREDQLVGLTVRVRGYLDDRFGAAMDVTSAEQIEVLDPGPASGFAGSPKGAGQDGR